MSDAAPGAGGGTDALHAVDAAAADTAWGLERIGVGEMVEVVEVVEVTVRYWAAARAATGVASERLTGRTVEEVLHAAVEVHPGLRPISRVATFLLDGRTAARESVLTPGVTLEVLPPFAGG